MLVLLVLFLLILLFINIPVAISIGISTWVFSYITDIDLIRMPQSMFSSLNSFPLLAIPLFILAGKLMELGGISEKLIDFAKSLIGHFRGGLAGVSIFSSMLFAAVSGSQIATTIAIGTIMIPAMVKMGYDRNFASALHAATGNLGGLIPPSIAMILYAVIASVSIEDMFLAGIIPGILIGVSFMVYSYIISRKEGFGTTDKMALKDVLNSFRKSLWALMMPVIILGGIYGGFFTPTEAAAIAVIYGLFVGIFVYKQITVTVFRSILLSTVLITASISFIMATASFFGIWLALEQVPRNIALMFGEANLGPTATILLICIFLFILGTFMEAAAALIITTPILLPVAMNVGIDPVHFGIIMIVNLAIGYLTPPVGILSFVAAQTGNTKFESMIPKVIPFIIIMIFDLLLIVFLPHLSSGFANLFK